MRVLGNLIFWLVVGLIIYLYKTFPQASGFMIYVAIAAMVYLLLHVYLYNIIFVDSQRPAKYGRKGRLWFRNKDYQAKFKNQNQLFYEESQI
jgi:hypothetical protein